MIRYGGGGVEGGVLRGGEGEGGGVGGREWLCVSVCLRLPSA